MQPRPLPTILLALIIALCWSCGQTADDAPDADSAQQPTPPESDQAADGASPPAAEEHTSDTDIGDSPDPAQLPAITSWLDDGEELETAVILARHEEYFGDPCLMVVFADDPDFGCGDILYGLNYMAVYYPRDEQGYGQPIAAKYRRGDEQESFSSHGSPGALEVDEEERVAQGWVDLDLGDGDAIRGRFTAELCRRE